MADEIKDAAKHWVTWENLPAAWQDDTQLEQAVIAALLRYDRDAPRSLLGSFVGDGTATYDLSAQSMTGWSEDSSVVAEVEYPYTLGSRGNVLDWDEWVVQDDPTTGQTLLLIDRTPSASETIKVKFSAPHVETSVPTRHISSVAKLAASGVARMFAARRAQGAESSLQADRTGGTTESEQWTKIADKLKSLYMEELGLGKGNGAGSAVPVAPGFGVFEVEEGSGHGIGKLHDYSDE